MAGCQLRKKIKLKVLFLDIDGVLNTEESVLESVNPDIMLPELINNLNLILESCRPKIVISSAWRFYNKFPDELIKFGVFEAEKLYLGHTPFEPQKSRGLEIKQWIKENSFEGTFAVIDDFDEREDLGENWFLTSCHYGLTKEIAEDIICHLGYYEKPIQTNILCFECNKNYGTECPGREKDESTRCEDCFEKYMAQLNVEEKRYLSQFDVCNLCLGNKRIKTDKGSEKCKKCDGIGLKI